MTISKRPLCLSFILVCALAALIGCRKAVPVESTSSSMPITATAANKAKIGDAIIRAGAATNWKITPAGDGKMTGTLNARAHTAVVSITYDDASYRIDYKDSVNLNYKDGNIHPNYNKWVHTLDKNIRAEIAQLNK
ncbi:MAG: hypothetical protein LBC94_02010 [Desulfovibrio sp.]|jgi:hypothetical protein|nr:hypothetical protein [Desulfovibrio sp.]